MEITWVLGDIVVLLKLPLSLDLLSWEGINFLLLKSVVLNLHSVSESLGRF